MWLFPQVALLSFIHSALSNSNLQLPPAIPIPAAAPFVHQQPKRIGLLLAGTIGIAAIYFGFLLT